MGGKCKKILKRKVNRIKRRNWQKIISAELKQFNRIRLNTGFESALSFANSTDSWYRNRKRKLTTRQKCRLDIEMKNDLLCIF